MISNKQIETMINRNSSYYKNNNKPVPLFKYLTPRNPFIGMETKKDNKKYNMKRVA
jgi:hypothetical protein